MTNKIELSIYGTRGSCATGSKEYMEFGGDTSSYALRIGDAVHFLDAGSGMRRAMTRELKPEVKAAYMHISHGHLDHIDMGCAGQIYFNQLPGGLHVSGYRHLDTALKHLFNGKTSWPVKLGMMKGLDPALQLLKGGETLTMPGGYKVSTLENYHPVDDEEDVKNFGGSIGFRFDIPKDGGLVRVAYASDLEFDYVPGCKPQTESKRLRDEFVNFVQGADVALVDTQFTRKEYTQTRAFVKGWGHPALEDVIELATQAGVKKLLGVHHDPAHTDEMLRQIETEGIEYAKQHGFKGEFRLARDGDRIQL